MTLAALGCAGDVESAKELFSVMRAAGGRPTEDSYRPLVDVLARCGRLSEAQMVLREMRVVTGRADTDEHVAVIRGLGARGDCAGVLHTLSSSVLLAPRTSPHAMPQQTRSSTTASSSGRGNSSTSCGKFRVSACAAREWVCMLSTACRVFGGSRRTHRVLVMETSENPRMNVSIVLLEVFLRVPRVVG